MLLALSKPAWIWAKTLSGSQHSPAGQLAGIGGETVFALMPRVSPSLTNFRQSERPIGGRV
jgi:hypothetical protein